ncbi:bifunctional methyltransferase/pyrophosphohydrolase YabN [Anaerosinus massiliensis]|uniref:nucleoside triphosphate pyrophosphohydrolase n=1 Tax=Massilibacillus massiliensis TaxID=1806837 RepID=UPI000AA088C4|nr:nucleoside triphosphate pyrophosphohydrolase [Massilibacillus massiliensis]
MGEIIIVGLGPGSLGFITLETWDKLTSAKTLLLRTAKHPTVEELRKHKIEFSSYDEIYDTKATFEDVYQTITQDVIRRAKQGEQVVYAVPGSPLVAEKTVLLIRDMAKEENIKFRILPGMSFIEVLYVQLGIDPIDGLTVIDSEDAEGLPEGLPTAIVVTQVYNQQVASNLKLSLMERYPDDFDITLLQNLGLENEEIITIPLYELDRQPHIDHLTSVYVPALQEREQSFSLSPIVDVMAKLRSPEGCVWDIEQTHKSLRRYIIEEVYEVIEAIDLEDAALLCEELGDLLLQIVFHARMAEETGAFTMQDVVDRVTEKMIHRHPHVFGDISVRDAGEVVLNWEAIKKEEKKDVRKSILDGVPKDLPSLMKAYKLQHKAAKVGFDWDNIAPVWDKIREEVAELKQAIQENDKVNMEAEFGDVLFSIVNLSRFLNIDPEVALNRTNHKFIRRFSYIENNVKKKGEKWDDLTIAELNRYWNESKVLNL